jgi:hypothetical protein
LFLFARGKYIAVGRVPIGLVRAFDEQLHCDRAVLPKGMATATGLDSLLESLSRCLDIESARRIIEFQAEAPVQQRIESLAGRANEGTLTGDERTEYEALINAADFISILKLKARQHLDANVQ